MRQITTVLRVASSRSMFLLPSVLICLFAISIGAAWQVRRPQASEKDEVRERIAVLIHNALEAGNGSVEGVRTWSRVPPSPGAVEEIIKFGDDAVPVLTRYLDSNNEPERAIAVEFLGRLGGERIIVPLRKVIKNDSSRSMRIEALGWISQAPWEQASPVISEAADTDPDPKVREAAKEILVKHK